MRHNRARELRTQGLAIIQLAGLQKFMIAFMILALMSLPFVQPIQKKEEAKKEEVKSVGDMMVDIVWPGCKKYEQTGGLPVCVERIDVDVDLWVKSPDDEKPVGFSNRAGKTFNLTRDDLGTTNDVTDRNMETASTRGLPAGEYIVNIYLFKNYEPDFPEVPVEIVISTRTTGVNGESARMKQIITQKAVLRIDREEITVVRFVIGEDGNLDPSSVNDYFKGLFSWESPTQ